MAFLLPQTPLPTPSPSVSSPSDGTAAVFQGVQHDASGAPVTIQPSQVPGAPPTLTRPASAPVSDAASYPAAEKDKLFIEAAKDFRTEPGNPDRLIAEGDVELRYNGYRVQCDRATVDRNTRLATFEGNARLITARQTVYGDYIGLNMDSRDFTARNAHTIIPADMIGGSLLEPLYISGKTIERKGSIITIDGGDLTTCDFPLPHYHFRFKSARIVPNDRVVMRKTSFYHYNSRIFELDYLSIPIRDQQHFSFVPEVGYDDVEGYYIKSALGYSLATDFPGLLRLDLMSKKGIGYGDDQAYRFGQNAAGTVVIYALRDKTTGLLDTSGRLNHVERFGDIDLSVTSDFQSNSYYAATANSTTQNSTVTLNRVVGPSTTGITYNFSNSSLTGSNSNSDAYTITQDQKVASDFHIKVKLSGSDQSNSFDSGTTTITSGQHQQTGEISATGRVGIFDMDFEANKSLEAELTGSSGSSNFFSGTERLPELTLRTTGDRLGGSLRGVPLNFSLGLGEYVESPGDSSIDRLLFDVDGSRAYPLAPRNATTLTMNGGFRQYLYASGDAAQYVLESSPQLTQKVGRDGTFNLNYSYLRPYGGTPINFRYDQVGSNNNLGTSFTVASYRTKLSLLTGYDIQRSEQEIAPGIPRDPWQNLATQIAFRPLSILQTQFTTTYDLNNDKLVDAMNVIRIRAASGYALDTTERFDPVTHKFPQLTGSLQSPLFGDKARMTAYVSYDGLTHMFDYRSFSLTRSLHDYEITLSYIDQPFGFETNSGISFTVRFKAFPGVIQSNTGQYGTALDASQASIF